MDIKRWKLVERLFDTALTLSVKDRHTYLEDACSGDTELIQEVLSLLAADEDIPNVLKSSLLDTTDWSGHIGKKFGVYRIESRIAHGGMGDVFLASRDDGVFQKKVAIKIIHAGLQSSEFIKRFHQERQILAGLNHPNIARLLDGGLSDDGLQYLVMEYIDGLSLDKFLDEENPDLQTRLDLFGQICDAVGYAHRHLVVHRDLKPDNIFINKDRRIVLLDFGIAKVFSTDDNPEGFQTMVQSGPAPFTPQYASPEQIESGEITTASDIYSLGVIFYQMLSGRLPYKINPAEPLQTLQILKNEIPIRPSLAARQKTVLNSKHSSKLPYPAEEIKGDLDTICLKALKKEANLRYGTIDEFKTDINRYLNGLPVSAADDVFTYRVSKFFQRHTVAVTISFVFSLMLIAVVGFYTWQLKQEVRKSQIEMHKSVQVAQFLKDMFDAAGPQSSKGKDATARDLLETGAIKIEKGLLDQPEVQAEMYGLIGDVFRRIGVYGKAEQMEDKALERNITLYGAQSEAVARSYYALAALNEERMDIEKAEKYYSLATSLLPRVRNKPGLFLADILLGKANIAYQDGDFIRSDSLYTLAYNQYLKAEGDVSLNVATTLNGRADNARRLGNYKQAEELYLKSLKIRKELLGADHADVAHSLNHIARLYSTMGRYNEAEVYAREGLAVRLGIYGENHAETGASMANLANILKESGHLAESEKYYRKALSILRNLFGENHIYVAATLSSLAATLYKQGKIDTAGRYFRQSIQINNVVLPEGHNRRSYALIGLGRLLSENGEPEKAFPLLQKAYNLRVKAFGYNNKRSAQAGNVLGACLVRLKRYNAASEVLAKSLEVFKREKSKNELDETRAIIKVMPKMFRNIDK